jgi:adenylate kinase
LRKKTIIITGISGVGKTTVLNEVIKLAKNENKDIKIFNYGSIMLEVAEHRGEKIDRDGLRHIPLKTNQKLQDLAAIEIAKKMKGLDAVIVDTHMIVRTDTGYWSGLPLNILEKLNPDHLILIEAEPEEVLLRRTKDETRLRDEVIKDEIIEEINFSRYIAASCETVTGAPVLMLKNPTGEQLKVAKQIFKVIKLSDSEKK